MVNRIKIVPKRGVEGQDETSLFGPPALIPGEDPEAFNELLCTFAADVRPKDVIEKMLIRDVADLTWGVLRQRRLEMALISSDMLAELNRRFEKELLDRWRARDPDAIEEMNGLLAEDGETVEEVAARALSSQLKSVERIEQMTMCAEARRNAALREIERHRETLGQALRQSSDKVIEAQVERVLPIRRRLGGKV